MEKYKKNPVTYTVEEVAELLELEKQGKKSKKTELNVAKIDSNIVDREIFVSASLSVYKGLIMRKEVWAEQ